MLKKCTKCLILKPIEEYRKNKSRCIICLKQDSKEYYENNKEKIRKKSNESKNKKRKELRKMVSNIKNKPCKDCNKCFPSYVMDLDHLKDKEYTIDYLINDVCLKEKLIKEIEKCEVVCANCHRIRTEKRRKEKNG